MRRKQQVKKPKANTSARQKKPASVRDAAAQHLEENKDIAIAVEAMRTARLAHDTLAQYRGRRVYRAIPS